MPAPGIYIFYPFGAGSTLVMDFMLDGRLKVTGENSTEQKQEVYMLHDVAKHFLTELTTIAFEDLMPNEERYEDCIIV